MVKEWEKNCSRPKGRSCLGEGEGGGAGGEQQKRPYLSSQKLLQSHTQKGLV